MAASVFLRDDYLLAIDWQGHPAGLHHVSAEYCRCFRFPLISSFPCTQGYIVGIQRPKLQVQWGACHTAFRFRYYSISQALFKTAPRDLNS